ncbi:hypothetical protein AB1I62_03950 [Enterococcus sp. AN402]|uniref:hypothetical protein n=1 Tax=Enterococcus sp. AN402 TaxID=3151386 RepID=UPI0034577168
MSNSFIASAQKMKREQEKIEQTKPKEELQSINIRIPVKLHYAVQVHRLETGENMTQLIRRLLNTELNIS